MEDMQFLLWTIHKLTTFYLTLICTGRPVTSRSILQPTRRCWTGREERRPPTGDLMIRSTPGPEQSKSKGCTSSMPQMYWSCSLCISFYEEMLGSVYIRHEQDLVFFTVEVMTRNTDAMISNWSREFRDSFHVGVSCIQSDRTQSSRSVQ